MCLAFCADTVVGGRGRQIFQSAGLCAACCMQCHWHTEMKHPHTTYMSCSRKRRNRNRNLTRLFREICYTEQCTALSSADRERKLDRLRLELEGFQRGKQYASSAVHRPDQFEDKPILNENTYAKFED